ncbi:MAG: pyridoxal phosphate-dependent aminotransferase [Candidatus Competibacteraceae bacterium]|nr:pyridoxal phosphate-dependent aminotransferase [Candidatus Competibacteraceae bacterium]MBK7984732.1 pyridoxal phosphate-dependent aminotransferase [Candidatus Competibacteraceae bacterium]MBK8899502.1 pyridoxal phosphate-dependent aminotransferase [Candidatus Competibacteraceae bacterium]MBK9952499.1 pyridoxal phosphate-dependent aminotransferase [Candidatus Competibacteraceae bacterium]
MADIAPFHVMALLARAKELEAEGRSVIHMEIGEPDFPTAAPIVAAGQRALAEGRTRYTAAAGLPELRRAISDHYRLRYGVEVPARRILITPGASGALQLATALLVNPDDRVLLADPGYPCNRHFVRLVEGEPVGVPVGSDSGYQLTAQSVERYWDHRTAAVLLASPANPTGTVVAPDELAAIVAMTEKRGGRVIVDEIYHGLSYGAAPQTALAYSERVLVINSFSKYYGMTGWRLGWLVAPDDCVNDAEKLAQNLFLAASTPAQHAALAAFTPDAQAIFEERRAQFQARRDFLLPALRELGFRIPVTPDGAFYLYADCGRFTDDSYGFALRLLEQTGVAITPGLDFGNHLPERHVRFAYTNAIPVLAEGLERLRRALAV